MTLFTKANCDKCDNIKGAFNLSQLGVNVEEIRADDPDVLAHLAWHELVDLVDQGALPILVLDDGTCIPYETPIRRYLETKLTGTVN